MLARIPVAMQRCARYAGAIFLTYVLSAAVGASMAHGGNRLALAHRDGMVQRAVTHDRASLDYRAGRRVRAALIDAAANFGRAALPQTVLGLTVVLPFGTVAQQGWAGGVVSVDAQHQSRLRTLRGASYYLGVLFLQFVAFSLCIGAGVRTGVCLYRANQGVGWRVWQYRPPPGALADAGYVIAAAVPVFLVASAFEFLSPWNR